MQLMKVVDHSANSHLPTISRALPFLLLMLHQKHHLYFVCGPRKPLFTKLGVMFAISVTEIVISVNAGFILGCIRQCFSAPASSSCLVLPQITAGRKGTPCTATAPQPRGWIHQREEKLLYCSAMFWGSHPIAPLSSLLFARSRSPHKAQVVVLEALFVCRSAPRVVG